MTKFAPGEVTPEQLEQYRLAHEAAKAKEWDAWVDYDTAYRVYCHVLSKRKEAESVYMWAKQGMVKVTE